MNLLSEALFLASQGFHIFPLRPNSKLPAIERFPKLATRDPKQITKWWTMNPEYNIGISTSKYGDNEAILGIDIDNKGDKNGSQEVERLAKDGKIFSETFEQITASGTGYHLLYRIPEPVKQGVDVIAPGIDIRSGGGYLVGSGSVLDGKTYTSVLRPVRQPPAWLDEFKKPKEKLTLVTPALLSVQGADRFKYYLINTAPIALSGDNGDQTTFKVAAYGKDLGLDAFGVFELMSEFWNPKCQPPWDANELNHKIQNAFSYGTNSVGSHSPEAQFTAIEKTDSKPSSSKNDIDNPIKELNKRFAYLGGDKALILHETTDEKGRFSLEFWDKDTFKSNLSPDTMMFNGKTQKIAPIWLDSKDRREYSKLCFSPEQKLSPQFYNLWRGFDVRPMAVIPAIAFQALEFYLDHILQNICSGNKEHYQYIIKYFAHLIQKPWERPNVAIVFRGKKGTGKNVLVETIGNLLGTHYEVVYNSKQVLGNFNSILDNKLFIVLDEAFWSGDKSLEGPLKHLITGTKHIIERKGFEIYNIDNCLRVAILGNEDWIVPATDDERRYAVFNVGQGRIQDDDFFGVIIDGMKQGGSNLLLDHLKNINLKDFNVRKPPQTQGLLDQKEHSMEPIAQWWKECLLEGRIVDSDFGSTWETDVETDKVQQAIYRHLSERKILSRRLTIEQIGKKLKTFCNSIKNIRLRKEGKRVYFYQLPSLTIARQEWDERMGFPTQWDDEIDETDIFD